MPPKVIVYSAVMTERSISALKKAAFTVVVTVAGLLTLNFMARYFMEQGLNEEEPPAEAVHHGDEPRFVRDGDWWVTPPAFDGLEAPQRFAVESRRWRVIVLGGSFALGTPYSAYEHGEDLFGSIHSWLREAMEQQWPGQVEVISAGVGGLNASGVSHIARSVLEMDPDALLIATGNNEGVLDPNVARSLLREVDAYRALSALIAPRAGAEAQLMWMPQDPDTVAIREQYRRSVEDIIGAAQERDVPVYLATLPINLRYSGPDLGHVPDTDLQSNGACAHLHTPVYAGGLESLIEDLRACPGLEDVKSWIGLSLLRLGRPWAVRG